MFNFLPPQQNEERAEFHLHGCLPSLSISITEIIMYSFLRLGDRASYINKYSYQLDAANYLLVVNQFSTYFGRVYAHLQEFELPYTAFGFQSCKMKCCVMEAYCVKLW
jgi:hypothetical protein